MWGALKLLTVCHLHSAINCWSSLALLSLFVWVKNWLLQFKYTISGQAQTPYRQLFKIKTTPSKVIAVLKLNDFFQIISLTFGQSKVQHSHSLLSYISNLLYIVAPTWVTSFFWRTIFLTLLWWIFIPYLKTIANLNLAGQLKQNNKCQIVQMLRSNSVPKWIYFDK